LNFELHNFTGIIYALTATASLKNGIAKNRTIIYLFFCFRNSVSSVFTLKIPKRKSAL